MSTIPYILDNILTQNTSNYMDICYKIVLVHLFSVPNQLMHIFVKRQNTLSPLPSKSFLSEFALYVPLLSMLSTIKQYKLFWIFRQKYITCLWKANVPDKDWGFKKPNPSRQIILWTFFIRREVAGGEASSDIWALLLDLTRSL